MRTVLKSTLWMFRVTSFGLKCRIAEVYLIRSEAYVRWKKWASKHILI
ncbi:hypothetical protein [Bacteroides thetaiotaomicron]